MFKKELVLVKSTIRYWGYRIAITRNLKREDIVLPIDFQNDSCNKKSSILKKLN